MPNFLILEPDLYGHKWYYTRYLIDQALADGHNVTAAVLTPRFQDLRSQELKMLYGKRIAYLEVESPTVMQPAIMQALSQHQLYTDIVVPSGDALIRRLFWRNLQNSLKARDTRLRILVMRPPLLESHSPIDFLKRLALRRVARNDQIAIHYLTGPGMEVGKSGQVPDPVETTAALDCLPKALAKLDSSKFWFGIVGTIWPRKNPELVVRALAQSSSLPTCGIVIAGEWDPNLWRRIGDFSQILRSSGIMDFAFINQRLTDEELDSTISWLDCVVLAHSNEGSSGILGKASALGTRVLGSGAKSLRQDLNAIDGTWCPLSLSALSEAMKRAARSKRPPPQKLASPSDFAKALLYGDGDEPIRGARRL